MTTTTQSRVCQLGCSTPVPPELEAESLCILHFTLNVEQVCAAKRRELSRARPSHERDAEIARCVTAYALTLARVATGSCPISDEMKKRILSTFLTLMVLKESLDRTAARAAEPGLAGPLLIPHFSRTA